jgi:hexokinase
LYINVVAIVNDTIGTLVSHSFVDPETKLGVIIGTGSNAAYVEKIQNIPKWKTEFGNIPVESGINTNFNL